jgi:hypothetical protein
MFKLWPFSPFSGHFPIRKYFEIPYLRAMGPKHHETGVVHPCPSKASRGHLARPVLPRGRETHHMHYKQTKQIKIDKTKQNRQNKTKHPAE